MSGRDIVPATTDVEAVLHRAIEKAQADEHSVEPVLDARMLAAIAAEVGVSGESLAAALAETQAGADGKPGVIDKVIGPRTIWASRRIDADEEEARRRVIDWLESNHGLRPRVRTDGVVVARKRRDVAGKLAGGIRRVQGLGGLGTASSVQAAAVGTDDGPGSVCVAADVGNKRKEAVAGGSVIAAGGAMVVGVVALVTSPVALVGVPVFAGVGTLTSRIIHRSTVRRVGDTLEETIDGVARGDQPPHPMGRLKRRPSPRSELS